MEIKKLKNEDIDKRPRYFAGQYLLEDDFESEQNYSRDRLQRYTRSLHVAGIADGLIAKKLNPNDATLNLIVEISDGTAIDPQGRQIVLPKTRQVDLSKDLTVKLDNDSYILSIGYDEQESDPRQEGNATRILEKPIFKLIKFSTSPPSEDFIAIAKLTIQDGNVSIPDDSNSVRKYTGLRLPSSSENPLTLRSGGGNLAVFSGSLEIAGSQTVGSTTLESHLYLSGATGRFAQFYRDAIDGKDYLGIEAFKQNDAQIKSAIVLQEFGGNVGIGTANPGTKLEVSGGDLKVNGNISATNERLSGNLSVTGNVGIGTASPGSKLEVKGDTTDYNAAALNVTDFTSKSLLYVRNDGSVGIGTATPGGKLHIIVDSPQNANGKTLILGSTGASNLRLGYDQEYSWIQSHGSKPLAINPLGSNVGIGTTTPGATLEVKGSTNNNTAAGLNVTDSQSKSLLYVRNDGNVGIGTTTPAANLQVRDTIASRNNYDFSKTALLVNSQTNNGGNSPANAESVLALAREGVPNQSYGNMVDFRLSNYKNVAPVDGTQLDLYLTEGGFSPKQVMSLRANGKVGIGTTTPTEKLEISGNLLVNGTIQGTAGFSTTPLAERKGAVLREMDGDAQIAFNYVGDGKTINNQHIGIYAKAENTEYKWFLTKTFVINHPQNPSKYLIHGTLEGPEAAVYYRGTDRLVNGKAEITLPDYFEALTRQEGRTIVLTNINGFDRLMIQKIDRDKIRNGKFIVVSDNPDSCQEFDWEVKAVRQDVLPLAVEPDKKDLEVKGYGPYTYAIPKTQ